MNPATHPVEPEEVMALHDGELEPADTARVEVHLRACAECQKLAAGLGMASTEMANWLVGVPVSVSPLDESRSVAGSALNGIILPPRVRVSRRIVWLTGFAAAACVVVAVLSSLSPSAPELDKGTEIARYSGSPMVQAIPAPASTPTRPPGDVAQNRISERELRERRSNEVDAFMKQQQSALEAKGLADYGRIQDGATERAMRLSRGPMVIRTVGLAIVAEDFAKARASLEQVLATYNGFAAQLSAADEKGAAQTLTATLRVPADKLQLAISGLKKLGRVEAENHHGEEVTQQYTDLNARLSNARNTEQRLIAVLQQRTGKVRDILEVEQEIARVREEIERMDAQRRTMENQVQLATIQLQIRENYKASLDVTPPSTRTRLWNSLVAGITSAANTVVAFVMFALEAGPTLLLWAAVLFLPARFAWRRLRPMWNMPNLG